MENKRYLHRKKTTVITAVILLLLSMSFKNKEIKVRTVSTNRVYVTDTIPFAPNISNGWGAYVSYLYTDGDSVDMELILNRQVPEGNKWDDFNEFGTVDSAYFPVSYKLAGANEPNREWIISIQTDGKCLIKLVNGPDPEGSFIVLPFKTKYKK